jgi:hypothetical protein
MGKCSASIQREGRAALSGGWGKSDHNADSVTT